MPAGYSPTTCFLHLNHNKTILHPLIHHLTSHQLLIFRAKRDKLTKIIAKQSVWLEILVAYFPYPKDLCVRLTAEREKKVKISN